MPEISGIPVSTVGLGCNNFGMTMDQDQASDVVSAALDCGMNFFDTADVYGGTKSETFLGQALTGRRDQAVVTTKFGVRLGELEGGASPDYARSALEASLGRLCMDHVDIFMLHYPASWMIDKGYPDAGVPIAETLGGLHELVQEGKARTIGCSNFSAEELIEADDVAIAEGLTRFSCVQNGLSLLDRDDRQDLLPLCHERGIAYLPYFPLASGLLTGKYRRGADFPPGSRMDRIPQGMWSPLFTDDNFDRVERLAAFAEDRGHSLVDLAFSWLAALPAVTSITAGATSAQQIKDNAGAAQWALTADDMATVESLL